MPFWMTYARIQCLMLSLTLAHRQGCAVANNLLRRCDPDVADTLGGPALRMDGNRSISNNFAALGVEPPSERCLRLLAASRQVQAEVARRPAANVAPKAAAGVRNLQDQAEGSRTNPNPDVCPSGEVGRASETAASSTSSSARASG